MSEDLNTPKEQNIPQRGFDRRHPQIMVLLGEDNGQLGTTNFHAWLCAELFQGGK